MSVPPQSVADKYLKARREAKRRRSVEVEVHFSSYEMVDVELSKIPTADLVDELREREQNGAVSNDQGDFEDGYQSFTLDRSELERIRHLFLIGREVEASGACRVLLADMLGTAL